MKIYTKTGDSGETGLVGNRRIAKDSLRIEAIGDVDELNTALGIARCDAYNEIASDLAKIQNWIFNLGAELASVGGKDVSEHFVTEDCVEYLERSMDRQTENLSPLRNFILPGGGRLSACLHHARSVCRRSERSVLALHRIEGVRDVPRKFLNRLSDWLFVTARTANARERVQDIEWTK